ncbi:hypothetical protein BT69DRAFT_1350566 [Atractiella rhizophila]|nr:hypothetical protein BT69DRAFT_1350566 [Atractiella rhizophila]
MSSSVEALQEIVTSLDLWLLKWGVAVKFDHTTADLQDVWSMVYRLANTLHESIDYKSKVTMTLEQWHYEASLRKSANLYLNPDISPASSPHPRSSFENLPTEILQSIFDKAIPAWDEDSFTFLCLSRRLSGVVQRALYHTPPALIKWQDVHSFLQKFENFPKTATFIRHLRYAVPSEQLDLLQRLSIFKLFSKCTSLQILSVFSDLTAIFEDLHFFEGYALLQGMTTVTELQILDRTVPRLGELIRCLGSLKTINILDGYRRRGLHDKLWSSQDTEHYELARSNLVAVPYIRRFETHMHATADMVLPTTLQDLRMLYDDCEEDRDLFMIKVLINNIRQNQPLPHFRLLELLIPDGSLDDFLYPILRTCKGTLEILRLSLQHSAASKASAAYARSTTHAGCARSNPHASHLSKNFYDLTTELSRLHVLELRNFCLAPCTFLSYATSA